MRLDASAHGQWGLGEAQFREHAVEAGVVVVGRPGRLDVVHTGHADGVEEGGEDGRAHGHYRARVVELPDRAEAHARAERAGDCRRLDRVRGRSRRGRQRRADESHGEQAIHEAAEQVRGQRISFHVGARAICRAKCGGNRGVDGSTHPDFLFDHESNGTMPMSATYCLTAADVRGISSGPVVTSTEIGARGALRERLEANEPEPTCLMGTGSVRALRVLGDAIDGWQGRAINTAGRGEKGDGGDAPSISAARTSAVVSSSMSLLMLVSKSCADLSQDCKSAREWVLRPACLRGTSIPMGDWE